MKTTIDIDDGLVPDGWELVRVGKPAKGEYFILDSKPPEKAVFDWRNTPCLIVRPKPKPLQIEAGKRYVRRDGSITGPLQFDGRESHSPWHDEKCSWTRRGTYWDTCGESHCDLISEYVEPEPKYRPFRDAAEFRPFHSGLFTRSGRWFCVSSFDNQTISFVLDGVARQETYEWFFEKATFEDGVVCGVRE